MSDVDDLCDLPEFDEEDGRRNNGQWSPAKVLASLLDRYRTWAVLDHGDGIEPVELLNEMERWNRHDDPMNKLRVLPEDYR